MSTTTETRATVQIVSVPPVKVADDEQVIAWSRRSTDKTPVPAEQRYRGIVIKRAALAVPTDAASSKFHRVLQATINDLAEAMFVAWVKDNMHTLEYEVSRMTLDNVLTFWAEEKQRTAIDGDKIVEWLKESATLKVMPEAKKKVWLSKIPKIAAPSYKQTFTKEQAAAIVAQIAEADVEHPAAVFVLQRANNILSQETVQEAL